MSLRKSYFLLLIFVSFTHCPNTLAQVNSFCQAHADTLYCKIPSLYGDAVVNPLEPLDQALATQLTLVPLASPASGIVYIMTPDNKLPQQSGTETFGPVLTERGETLYSKKLFVAATYQRFRFNSLDGVNLKQIPMFFEFCRPSGQCGPIAIISRTDAHLDQYALFGTYGITNWLDTSIALPILNVTIAASGVRCVPPYCSFTTPGGDMINFQPNQVSGSATGIGDVVIRGKANVISSKKYKLAIGCDVRLPSGDALNFLGAGAPGVKPFEAVSRSGRFSPHVNVAYQWNGNSFLAGAVAGTKGDLPDILSYAVGADWAAVKNLTVSGDYLGEHVIDASRLAQITTLNLPNTTRAQGTFDTSRGAVGFKWKPMKELLISGNLLFKFDHNGLHHTAVPLIGVSYTWDLRRNQ